MGISELVELKVVIVADISMLGVCLSYVLLACWVSIVDEVVLLDDLAKRRFVGSRLNTLPIGLLEEVMLFDLFKCDAFFGDLL